MRSPVLFVLFLTGCLFEDSDERVAPLTEFDPYTVVREDARITFEALRRVRLHVACLDDDDHHHPVIHARWAAHSSASIA